MLSMLREAVWRGMDLVRRGIHVDPAGPTRNLYADGATYDLGDDMADNVAETITPDGRVEVLVEDWEAPHG
jgi:hypothetical protein